MTSIKMPLAWHEPDKNDKKDPWAAKRNDGPPDLEKFFKKIFAGLKGKGPSHSGSSHQKFTFNLWLLLAIIAILYFASGIYIVQEAERAVITRFGKFNRVSDPGPHWLPPLIEDKALVNVELVTPIRHTGLMLTEDENIVSVEVVVQYQVIDAEHYLFNDIDPKDTLRQATESALRQVIGHSSLDDVLTSGRARIAGDIKAQLQTVTNSYNLGLQISDVAMQPAKAPDEVKSAFDDVIKAREEEVSLKNRAEAYANDIKTKAQGQAERIIKEAAAYKEETVLNAQGHTQRFNLILPHYQKNPQITLTRIYIDAIEQIFSTNTKILLDVEKGNPLLYLPLDKIMNKTQHSIEANEPLYKEKESNYNREQG